MCPLILSSPGYYIEQRAFLVEKLTLIQCWLLLENNGKCKFLIIYNMYMYVIGPLKKKKKLVQSTHSIT